MSTTSRPKANTSHYSEKDFFDVSYIKDLTNEELEKEDKKKIAKYCESLIRSAENSGFVLKKFISKADMSYTCASGDNLLNIAILSGNFKPIEILLEHKCPRDIPNKRGYTAEGFVALTSCHKTVKSIFKKFTPVVEVQEVQNDSVPSTVETTTV